MSEEERRQRAVVGYVDRLGYLYCRACAGDRELPEHAGVRAGTGHDGEPCDACGRIVRDVPEPEA